MADEFEERCAEIREKYQTARYSFWSALLTVNAVFLSVPAALLSARPEVASVPFKIVGILSVVSIVALVFNFAATKTQYEHIGQRLGDAESELSDAEREKDIGQALTRHRWIQRSERLVMGLLLIQNVVLAYVLGHA
ncbi:MAG: hypothetical protein HYU77_07290 [Betaproteobacteria bacterium]|nr:hypothetical protein [Betaproteobacteria bacterium]